MNLANKEFQTAKNDHLTGCIRGNESGPTLIFMAGIHGNENSGVRALEIIMKELEGYRSGIHGSVYALKGNLPALSRNERYIDEDLNRLWTPDRIHALRSGLLTPTSGEERQLLAIDKIISEILECEKGPFYFFDLHTTSCETIPFLTVNDMRMNRVYAQQYPVPMILGIEEYLTGPLLSYINELGYVAFGFEAGQHDNLASLNNQLAFIRLTLFFTGVKHSEESFMTDFTVLERAAGGQREIYEIYFRQQVLPGESFEMQPGFENFQKIRKGAALATINGKVRKAERNLMIFMPLYQAQGDDGFFLIRRIPGWILSISDWLRTVGAARMLAWLPGVSREAGTKDTLLVDTRTARFLAREVFHLFGYRNKVLDKNQIRMKHRESVAREKEYQSAPWFPGINGKTDKDQIN